MTITSNDLRAALNRIRGKINATDWDRAVTAISAPVVGLQTELGPLTDKVGKESTIDAALMLMAQMESTAPPQALLTAVTSLHTSLVSSKVTASNAGIEASLCLNSTLQTLQRVVKQQTDGVPAKITTAPILIQLLDVMIIQAVAAVPVVGPGLAGLLGGVASGLSAGLTIGGNALASLLPAQDTKANPNSLITGVATNTDGLGNTTIKNVAKGVSGVVAKDTTFTKGQAGTIQGALEGSGALGSDVSKAAQQGTGLASFSYFLYQARADRAMKKKLEEIGNDSVGLATKVQGIPFIQNPQTQNQAAGNVIARRTVGVTPKPVVAAEQALKDNLQAEAKTVEAFFKKVPAIFDSYKDLLLAVAYCGVIDSFAPMARDFKTRMALYNMQLATEKVGLFSSRPAPLGSFLTKNAAKADGYIVALLIMGYYFNRLYKTDKAVQASWRAQVTKFYRTNPVRDPSVPKPQTVSSFAAATTRSTGGETIVSVFKETQSYTQLVSTPGMVDWATMERSASTYCLLVKNALVNEMAQEFVRSLKNEAAMGEMLQLTIACSLIVNQVITAAALGKEIAIDDRYISLLGDYVSLYTKVVFVSASRKAELTGSGLNAKLRYPKPGRLSTSASNAERTMVFIFASCVLAYVDVGKVVMGYQDWAKTKENLHLVIDEINKAEKD